MEPKGITINVDCHLSVPTETAEICLKLVEMFLNSNKGVDVLGERLEDGSTYLHYVWSKGAVNE